MPNGEGEQRRDDIEKAAIFNAFLLQSSQKRSLHPDT